MNTQTTYFAFGIIVIHPFDGNAYSIDGVGVIKHDEGKPAQLPEETIVALIQLAHILRPISERLLASGEYILREGRLVKNEQSAKIEQKL